MFSYIFGDNKISFSETLPSSITFQGCYKINISFANKTQFSATDKKIVIGGLPLTLNVFSSSIEDPYSVNPSAPKHLRPYSIEAIYINNIIPMNPSQTVEYSLVLNGIRISVLKGNDGRFYFNPFVYDNIPTITKQTIFNGVPLAIGENDELSFINSAYKENDIEEYSSFSLGGVPLTAGRVGNNWFILLSKDYYEDSDWGK